MVMSLELNDVDRNETGARLAKEKVGGIKDKGGRATSVNGCV